MPTKVAEKTDRFRQSAQAFERACAVMPGGVSSPVRAFKAVGRTPVTVRSGRGATLTDIDGNEYLDYVGSYGPLILGHAPECVTVAISKAAAKGTTFGLTTEAEIALAQMVIDAIDSVQLVRFVNSGTEAVMSAIRLARAATGRARVVKCTGCYHGHSDALLVEAGSGAMTLGTPSSPGVPASITSQTLLVPYNDLDAVEQVFETQGDEVACFVVEPVAGNMGCVPPQENYLAGLRELCDRHGVLLIFDEVMTGFRVHYGGAQTLYGVKPDLTCLGKVVGGGMPCAAYGGRADLMGQIAPQGPVYQAGTLSGNPLAMAAGLATLETLRDEDGYGQLERVGGLLEDGLARAAGRAGVPVRVSRVGSMISVFFTDAEVTNYEQARQCRTDRFAAFFGVMLDEGVMLPPSQFETWFVSTAHDESCIKQTLEAAEAAFHAAAKLE
ncbi:MAG: glutamate-1-semialdehyde 2,1-aminomutase [Phycisphaeraceae bacterium]